MLGNIIYLVHYFVNFNCKMQFAYFFQSSSIPCTVMAERLFDSDRTSCRFSKKRDKFYTIERRNRGTHPLRVLSPLEGIILRYPMLLKQDSIDSLAT